MVDYWGWLWYIYGNDYDYDALFGMILIIGDYWLHIMITNVQCLYMARSHNRPQQRLVKAQRLDSFGHLWDMSNQGCRGSCAFDPQPCRAATCKSTHVVILNTHILLVEWLVECTKYVTEIHWHIEFPKSHGLHHYSHHPAAPRHGPMMCLAGETLDPHAVLPPSILEPNPLTLL